MERQRGVNKTVNCVKTGGGLSWSTCEQGFVPRGEIQNCTVYVLTTSVVNF